MQGFFVIETLNWNELGISMKSHVWCIVEVPFALPWLYLYPVADLGVRVKLIMAPQIPVNHNQLSTYLTVQQEGVEEVAERLFLV